MLDIYTCIISCIIFSDLVPDIYFLKNDTWDSCGMHYLDYMTFLDYHVILSCDLEFLWSYDYVTWWLLIQNISCSLYYMSHHACMVSLYMIYHLDFPVIVITLSSRYCQTYCSYVLFVLLLYLHVLSFIVLLLSCVQLLVHLWRTLLFFSI